ncbi:MAG TPA: M48 family metalloprotease [Candidatus Nanoarchaeia archaeon]|nr:M48 family metalloprotease [Candidatus Nanoarchaeia archaeon]
MGIIESAVTFVTDPAKMLVVVVSVLFSIAAILLWKKYNKALFLYAHLFFVISPLSYFALSINCSMSLAEGLLAWCTTLLTKFVIFILPPLMALAFVSGYVLLPRLYRRLSKPLSLKTFKELCKLTGIRAELFLIDKAKPVAFTLRNKIFVSVGMFEILSKKELEAVLLHELYHVQSRSSWNKFSAGFVRLFSPIAWFSASSVEQEERAADSFAVRVQKSEAYLKSAKQKVSGYL